MFARSNTKTMSTIRQRKIIVDNNVWGLISVWLNKRANKNAYTDVLNMVISETGGLKKRRTAYELWTTLDSLDLRVYWMWFIEEFWFIRVRWDKIETLANENSVWTEIANWYNVSWKDKVQFIRFYATAETKEYTKTLSSESNKRYLSVNWLIPNELIWKLLKVWDETKLIEWNTDSKIYISEILDWTYSAWNEIDIYEQVPAIYMFSKWNDVKIWRWWTLLETIPFQIDKAVVQIYWWKWSNWRMFWIKENEDKIFISEVWTGEYSPKDNYFHLWLRGKIQNISIINNRAIIYSEYGRVSLLWDNIWNFKISSSSSHKWSIAPHWIAEWNNIEFYLSHEGVEFLNSIETATVTEGISMSDNIKRIFEKYDDFSWAMGIISNWKYFLSIKDDVFIYHLEKSVKNHKPIFTKARYTECSDKVVDNAISYEWTFAENIDWKLFFWQWWKTYQIIDEKIWLRKIWKKINCMIEFPPHFMGDIRVRKHIRKYRIFFDKDVLNLNASTKIKVFYKINDWPYEKIRESIDIFDIECTINKKVLFWQIKIEIEDINEEPDLDIQFHYSELEYKLLTHI